MNNSTGWEKAVLGTAIFSPELVEQAEFLLPSDFTGCHAGIWSNILNLHRREALELRTLVEELRQSTELDHISDFDGSAIGEAYIADLVTCRGMAMAEFASNVLNASGKRMLNREAALIAADARDESITYEQALDSAESRFISMRRRTALTEGASLADLFGVFIPRMEGMRAGTIVPRWTPKTLGVRQVFPYVEDDDYVIVAARPGLGKSSWARYEAYHATKADDPINVSIFNLENADIEYPRAITALHLNINSRVLREPQRLTERQLRQVIEAAHELSTLPLHIVSMGGPSVAEIDRVTRKHISKHKTQMIWVDYVQLISNGLENSNQDITKTSQQLRAMAKKYGIPVMACAQLNREIEHRSSYDPVLSDLRESGSLEQDATGVLFPCPVWKNPSIEQLARFSGNRQADGRPSTEVIEIPIYFKIAKNRNGGVGNTKEILWNKATGSYKTLTDDWSA